MCCNERAGFASSSLSACESFEEASLGCRYGWGMVGVGMRVRYFGSGGCRRGGGREGVWWWCSGSRKVLSGALMLAKVVLDVISLLFSLAWEGRWCWYLAGAVLRGIRDCTRRTNGPHYSYGGRHYPSGNGSEPTSPWRRWEWNAPRGAYS